MKGKVTQELIGKLKADRMSGMTYREIEAKHGIGRWTTLHYLKGIAPTQIATTQIWKTAEKKASEYLVKNGFDHLIDLNLISPQSYFDLYAEKDGAKWLIDVTINENKDLVSKSMRLVPGFKCAILYISHDLKIFVLVELKILSKNSVGGEVDERTKGTDSKQN
jgi:hypothetical protein